MVEISSNMRDFTVDGQITFSYLLPAEVVRVKYSPLILALLLAACGSPDTETGGGAKHSRVIEAENLLQAKAPRAFSIYRESITSVQVGEFNGITGGVLTLTPEYIESASIQYLASALAHDAYHAYHGIGCAPDEESEAIAYQVGVLRVVGGSDSEIEWLFSQAGTHQCEVV